MKRIKYIYFYVYPLSYFFQSSSSISEILFGVFSLKLENTLSTAKDKFPQMWYVCKCFYFTLISMRYICWIINSVLMDFFSFLAFKGYYFIVSCFSFFSNEELGVYSCCYFPSSYVFFSSPDEIQDFYFRL